MRLTACYWHDSSTIRDFFGLMKVRLALSKVGRYLYAEPELRCVHTKSLGRSIWLRSHTTDISVLSELLVSGQYGGAEAAVGRLPRVVVDLGANTGLAARWFARQYPGCRLVAVEPESGNVEILRRNLEPLAESAVIVPACIGAHARAVRLETDSGAWGFRMVDISGDDQTVPMPVVTMARLMEENAIQEVDLLKCDIEGAELELFENCRPWIGKVRAALVECHNGFTGAQLIDLIRRNGSDFEILRRVVDTRHGHEIVMISNRSGSPLEAMAGGEEVVAQAVS